jgi:uncharacterized tellurite resistance protein B-like protein
MRNYATDSHQAKARVIAIALLADGGLDKSELDLLAKHAVVERLGMSHEAFDQVVHEFCDDMSQFAHRNGSGELELGADSINEMLDEIQNPVLRKNLLRAVLEIVYADRRLSTGEAVLVSQAMSRWNINLSDIAQHASRPVRRWPPHVRRTVDAIAL